MVRAINIVGALLILIGLVFGVITIVRSCNATRAQHVGHEAVHVQLRNQLAEARAALGDLVDCGNVLYVVRHRETSGIRVASEVAPNGETWLKPYDELVYEHCSVVKYDNERWKSLAKIVFVGRQ